MHIAQFRFCCSGIFPCPRRSLRCPLRSTSEAVLQDRDPEHLPAASSSATREYLRENGRVSSGRARFHQDVWPGHLLQLLRATYLLTYTVAGKLSCLLEVEQAKAAFHRRWRMGWGNVAGAFVQWLVVPCTRPRQRTRPATEFCCLGVVEGG